MSERSQNNSAAFLRQRYPGLAQRPEVENAASRTEGKSKQPLLSYFNTLVKNYEQRRTEAEKIPDEKNALKHYSS